MEGEGRRVEIEGEGRRVEIEGELRREKTDEVMGGEVKRRTFIR